MKKVLIATEKPFAKEAVDQIVRIAEEAVVDMQLLEKYTSKSELLEAIKDVNAVIIRSDIIDKEVIDAAEQLEVVVRAGAGYDNVDLETATAKNVVVMNTPGQNSNAVAELAIGMMLYIARGCFNGKPGTEISNKTLGIHAYGNVGRLIAKIAKGFDMTIYAFDPFVDNSVIEKDGIIPVNTVEELYTKSQYVSLNIPANSQTKNSINKALLSLMPKDACLVNTARKEVVHEADLLDFMSERPDFKYVSDIAPDNADAFAEKFPEKFFFTPKKMGAQTAEANINAGIAAINQIIKYFNNKDTTFQVNK
jgi:D-3-phosphoglycerate dehydrogenase / 2-oxoglutarate reductase